MGLEIVSDIHDLNAAWPLGVDSKSEGANHLRNLKVAVQTCFPGLDGRAWRNQTKTIAYTLVATDNMTAIHTSAAITLSLTAAATLGNGFICWVYAQSGAVIIDPNLAELVNEVATVTLASGARGLLSCDGVKFYFVEFGVADLSITNAKLAQAYINDLTTVTYDPADFVAIADASDAFNKKKALLTNRLESITAVANTPANGVTITIPAQALQFRSVTLTTGTPVTRTNAGVDTLVLPASGTLGAVSAVASRILVLAVDDGTGFKTAIVNLAGGNNLDETGLITTVAISSTSNSNNVIYSTAVLTARPYKIMGFYDETQTVAGTHSAALTLVQGVGGMPAIRVVPAFSARADVTQSITSGAFTKVTLGTENFDTNNNFATSRFTPTVAGYYQFTGVIRIQGTTITQAVISIFKNGVEEKRGAELASAAGTTQLEVNGLIFCNGTTDFIELFGFITATTPSLNFVNSALTSTLSGALVRAA